MSGAASTTTGEAQAGPGATGEAVGALSPVVTELLAIMDVDGGAEPTFVQPAPLAAPALQDGDDKRRDNRAAMKQAFNDNYRATPAGATEARATALSRLRQQFTNALGLSPEGERDHEDRGRGLVSSRGAASLGRTYDGFAPRVGVLWQPRPEVQLFANVTRSADVPDFSDLTQTQVNGTTGFVPLAAQRAAMASRSSSPSTGHTSCICLHASTAPENSRSRILVPLTNSLTSWAMMAPPSHSLRSRRSSKNPASSRSRCMSARA